MDIKLRDGGAVVKLLAKDQRALDRVAPVLRSLTMLEPFPGTPGDIGRVAGEATQALESLAVLLHGENGEPK